MTEIRKKANILLVEDNPGDALLTREALEEDPWINITTVENGEKAMDYLLQQKEFRQSSPRPHLIILDLNLPRKSGLELLGEIKQDPRFQSIPVIVLTVSGSEQDIKQAYAQHANCFIVKPVRLSAFTEIIQGIRKFWLDTVILP